MANRYAITHIPNGNGIGYSAGASFTGGAFFGMLWDGTLPHGATVVGGGRHYEIRAFAHTSRGSYTLRQYLRGDGGCLWPSVTVDGVAVRAAGEMPGDVAVEDCEGDYTGGTE